MAESPVAARHLEATVIVLGRIQPIIATLAAGAIYFGIALLLRLVPAAR
jgi:ribose transport system permease protein